MLCIYWSKEKRRDEILLNPHHCGVMTLEQTEGDEEESGEWLLEKVMVVGDGNTNWFCPFHGVGYVPIDEDGNWFGWWRTNGLLWNMCAEGDVPADFGVINTELPGERLAGRVAAKLCGIIPCMWGIPPPPAIMLTPLPLMRSPMASWLAFWARLHLARLFWNQTCERRKRERIGKLALLSWKRIKLRVFSNLITDHIILNWKNRCWKYMQ